MGCSHFDIECLSKAMELSIKLVTDDTDLYDLAKEYEVDCTSTLELMKFMLDEKRVKLSDIQGTVVMWDYMNDFPRNFKSDFIKIFNVKSDRY